MIERIITVDVPFDLLRTMRALGVGERDDAGGWWWATMTASGTATIHLRRSTDGVVARGWGSGSEELVMRVPRLIGLDDDDSIVPRDDRSRSLLRGMVGVRLGSTGAVHDAIVNAVLGQVVTTVEAKRSRRLLMRRFGTAAEGPRPALRTMPPPSVLSSLSFEDLHPLGIERRRADTLVEVSRRADRLAEILELPVADAWRRLEAVRGVGPWTAAHVMGTAYGDRDAVPVGDYHLPNAVAFALAGEDRATDDRMLELLEPYRPERRRMIVAIKQAALHAPRRGPRTATRRHL